MQKDAVEEKNTSKKMMDTGLLISSVYVFHDGRLVPVLAEPSQ